MVALELAKLLEQQGLTGQLISMDGSMLLFKKFLNALQPDMEPTIDSIQNFLLAQFAFEILPDQKPELIRSVLLEEPTWEKRMDKYISLMKKSDYSAEYLKDIGYGIQNRFKIVLKGKAEYDGEKIKANIILIRPTSNLVVGIENNYGLEAHTDGIVILHFVEGNHITMLDDTKLSEIINEVSSNIKRN